MSFWSLSWQEVILHYQVSFPHQLEAFMDDLFLSSSLSKIQELLNYASRPFSWERMPVKASKSQSLVSDSGKIVQDKSLCKAAGLNYQTILSIAENRVSDNSGKYQADSLILALTKGLGYWHRTLNISWQNPVVAVSTSSNLTESTRGSRLSRLVESWGCDEPFY